MDHVLPHEDQWPAVREGAKPMDMEGRLMVSGAHLPPMLVTLEVWARLSERRSIIPLASQMTSTDRPEPRTTGQWQSISVAASSRTSIWEKRGSEEKRLLNRLQSDETASISLGVESFACCVAAVERLSCRREAQHT